MGGTEVVSKVEKCQTFQHTAKSRAAPPMTKTSILKVATASILLFALACLALSAASETVRRIPDNGRHLMLRNAALALAALGIANTPEQLPGRWHMGEPIDLSSSSSLKYFDLPPIYEQSNVTRWGQNVSLELNDLGMPAMPLPGMDHLTLKLEGSTVRVENVKFPIPIIVEKTKKHFHFKIEDLRFRATISNIGFGEKYTGEQGFFDLVVSSPGVFIDIRYSEDGSNGTRCMISPDIRVEMKPHRRWRHAYLRAPGLDRLIGMGIDRDIRALVCEQLLDPDRCKWLTRTVRTLVLSLKADKPKEVLKRVRFVKSALSLADPWIHFTVQTMLNAAAKAAAEEAALRQFGVTPE